MKRNITDHIKKDLKTKIVLLCGPRQVGKTTLSKNLTDNHFYLNYDSATDREVIREKTWFKDSSLVIFDELHKKRDWKRWIKGIYDVEGINPNLLVTGSAKLNTHRRAGDSLAGRFFLYRLHPFDIKELTTIMPSPPSSDRIMHDLLEYSGFPEPFLKKDKIEYRKWKKSYINAILKGDLREISRIQDIQDVEDLSIMLRSKVGSHVAYDNFAIKLERDHKTIKTWITLLKELFVIFSISPYSKNITSAIRKMKKYYFYDVADIENPGAKFENLVACALLKEAHFIEDTRGDTIKICYLRTSDNREIDFVVVINGKPSCLIEAKLNDGNVSKSLVSLGKQFEGIPKIQLTSSNVRERFIPKAKIEIRHASTWLANIDFTKYYTS